MKSPSDSPQLPLSYVSGAAHHAAQRVGTYYRAIAEDASLPQGDGNERWQSICETVYAHVYERYDIAGAHDEELYSKVTEQIVKALQSWGFAANPEEANLVFSKLAAHALATLEDVNREKNPLDRGAPPRVHRDELGLWRDRAGRFAPQPHASDAVVEDLLANAHEEPNGKYWQQRMGSASPLFAAVEKNALGAQGLHYRTRWLDLRHAASAMGCKEAQILSVVNDYLCEKYPGIEPLYPKPILPGAKATREELGYVTPEEASRIHEAIFNWKAELHLSTAIAILLTQEAARDMAHLAVKAAPSHSFAQLRDHLREQLASDEAMASYTGNAHEAVSRYKQLLTIAHDEKMKYHHAQDFNADVKTMLTYAATTGVTFGLQQRSGRSPD